MFWIGLLPALLVFFIRRHVPESAVFMRSDDLKRAGKVTGGSLHIFGLRMLRTTILTSLLAVGAQADITPLRRGYRWS